MNEIKVNELDPLLVVPNAATMYVVSQGVDYKTTKEAYLSEVAGNSFKRNQIQETTLLALGVATFDLLTPAIVRTWINDENAPNQDNEIYYYQVTNGEFFRIYVLKNRLKNQLVTNEMVELIVDESKLSDYLLNGGYIGTAQDLDDAIEAGGQLVKITENGQTGYRLKDVNPANYGDIGQDAVDLSFQFGASVVKGATGIRSHAEGAGTTASGGLSHAEGASTTASGFATHTQGNNTEASGSASSASGVDTVARSYGEHAGGLNNTDYTPQSTTEFNLVDRLVSYGNGINTRSDAYTLFKNGMQKFFTAALSTITNATKGSVMLDENARMNIHDGFNFNQVAYTAEVLTKQNQKLTRAVSFTAENEQIYSITQTLTITNPTGVAGRGYEFEVLAETTTVGARTFEVGSYVKVKFVSGVFVFNLYAQKNVLSNVTITPANWTLVSGNFQATITDSLIFLGSTPIVTPTIATANIADLAEIFEDIIVSNGSFIITARYLPTANIVIKTTLL